MHVIHHSSQLLLGSQHRETEPAVVLTHRSNASLKPGTPMIYSCEMAPSRIEIVPEHMDHHAGLTETYSGLGKPFLMLSGLKQIGFPDPVQRF